jgi:acyl dehydratase
MGRVYSDFKIGERFKTPGRTITESDVAAFAGLTGDYNPVHCDEEFAKATEFGGRIAHGPFGLGLAFGLASRLDLIDGTVVALLGVTWDFRAPTRPGDTLHAEIVVKDKRDVKNPDHGLVELHFTLVNQTGATAQDGCARLLMRRTRPAFADWGEAARA